MKKKKPKPIKIPDNQLKNVKQIPGGITFEEALSKTLKPKAKKQ